MNAFPSGGYLSYLTAWATGAPQPATSNLTPGNASVASNAALVGANGGSISVYVSNTSDVSFGINGYFK